MRRSEREISDRALIGEILKESDVCRIALANDNLPYIVSLNFGFSFEKDLVIYFHCAPKGKKLEMIRRNNFVCFEMDTEHRLYTGLKACDFGMKYKSLVGYGTITIVTEYEEKIKGLNLIMDHYSAGGNYEYNPSVFERTTLLRLAVSEITGKKC
jgi:uncharacterized protein